ncbi:MAG: DUF3108 domain-containing protein [Deltaproteobacteria bacterium]|nr:DUF3108 domain-containing protein [Deltaproteobacteria bacterium]MBW1928535.1 DUF3108 domain-containing protein [Deltaproteobacteria bacterium]MBW2026087.1 DUF3108 domain-containing protein [Deltaproteobacteria bacterium]MBW2124592.1 DUF3108 domain-containing protein [Deltaproteobacteria bacterium]RLB10918.1 MAG: hypothetical protein DRG63_13475 [Deltaproteobacteria bacterium]
MRSHRNILQYLVLVTVLILVFGAPTGSASLEGGVSKPDLSLLRERIQFKVKWSFVPLIETYMELYYSNRAEGPPAYRLTHQAAMNSFWNDHMESVINSKSLLPYLMETIIKDGDKRWKEKVVFDRNHCKATFSYLDRKTGKPIVERLPISPQGMDPLSAFYNLRHRISPSDPTAAFEGLTGSRRFRIEGRLARQETVKVPAGTFDTYRIECSLSYWPTKKTKEKALKKDDKDEIKAFTLWITKDAHHYPVQIRYRLSLGSLWVRAVSVQDHGLFS